MTAMERLAVRVMGVPSLLLFAAVIALGQEKITPTRAVVRSGTVRATTTEDGMWTFMTVTKRVAGKEELVPEGFQIQYGDPTSLPANFQGEGEVTYRLSGDSDTAAPLTISIAPKSGHGWFFKLERCACDPPAGMTLIEPVGLARYRWDPKKPFTSHKEFVSVLSEDLARLQCPKGDNRRH